MLYHLLPETCVPSRQQEMTLLLDWLDCLSCVGSDIVRSFCPVGCSQSFETNLQEEALLRAHCYFYL